MTNGTDTSKDESITSTQLSDMINFTFNGHELIVASSSSTFRWDGFQYCLSTALKLLQDKISTDITKVSILKLDSEHKGSVIPSESTILEYLSDEVKPTDNVKIYQSNGNVMSKKMQDYSFVEGLNVSIDHTFDFGFIELLQAFAVAFPDVVWIAEYCELNREEVRSDLARKKVKVRESKNIFKLYSFEGGEKVEGVTEGTEETEENSDLNTIETDEGPWEGDADEFL